MEEYIPKSALVAEIERRIEEITQTISLGNKKIQKSGGNRRAELVRFLSFINTLEVKDPYEQCIQYPSVKDGIKAHAETYSFNIESELFNQLTKEQQALWRKEIEQACISGGEVGIELVRDPRYKENLEVKEVDLEKEYEEFVVDDPILGNFITNDTMGMELAKHFFELGMQVSNKAQKGEVA